MVARQTRRFGCLAIAFTAFAASTFSSVAHATEPGPLPITPKNLSAVVNSDSYGYDIKCIINGHDIGIVGGQSESLRQFDESSHEGSSDPADHNIYSTLHMGHNSVRITYRRKPPKEAFDLDISF